MRDRSNLPPVLKHIYTFQPWINTDRYFMLAVPLVLVFTRDFAHTFSLRVLYDYRNEQQLSPWEELRVSCFNVCFLWRGNRQFQYHLDKFEMHRRQSVMSLITLRAEQSGFEVRVGIRLEENTLLTPHEDRIWEQSGFVHSGWYFAVSKGRRACRLPQVSVQCCL
jgi:hypothetical protein